MQPFEWIATQVERNGEFFAHWIETTEPDRLDWKPLPDPKSSPRSILEFAAECATVNRGLAARLRGEPPAGLDAVSFNSGAGACEAVRGSARELAEVIRGLDEGVFGRTFEMPWGPASGDVLLGVAVRHLIYHGGQVNYIQTLYGDMDFHVPRT